MKYDCGFSICTGVRLLIWLLPLVIPALARGQGPTLISPEDDARNVPLNITLEWQQQGTNSFVVQVAESEDFSSGVVVNTLVLGNSYELTGLSRQTTYFWRVRRSLTPVWSETRSFATIPFPPQVETRDPEDISQESATLTGRITTEAQAEVHFNWGPEGDLSETTDTVTVSGRQSSRTVRLELSGLTPGTRYEYRMAASNGGGSAAGSTTSFITIPSAPDLVSPGTEEVVSPRSVTLLWDASEGADAYHLQVAANESFSEDTIGIDVAELTATAYDLGELAPEVTFFWRVRARNDSGTSDWSTSSFRTRSLAPQVETHEPESIDTTSATLTGTVITRSFPAQVYFEWGEDESFSEETEPQTIQAAESATQVTEQLSTLTPGTTYYYRLAASNPAGLARGRTRSFITIPRPPGPSVPENGQLILSESVDLMWNATPGAEHYGLQVAEDPSFNEEVLLIDESELSSAQYPVGNLNGGMIYYWRVRAELGGEAGDWSEVFSFHTYPESLGLQVERVFPNPDESSSYRMIGLPGNAGIEMNDVLPGNPAETWVAFYDTGGSAGDLLPFDGSEIFTFRPGTAFWILSRKPISYYREISPVELSEEGYYEIPLHDGWNLISNPFGLPVVWESVQNMNGVSEALWAFDGRYNLADSLEPYHGYYFFNRNGLTHLSIPYPGVSVPSSDTAIAEAEISTVSRITLRASAENHGPTEIRLGTFEKTSSAPRAVGQAAPPSHFEFLGLRAVDPHGTPGTAPLLAESFLSDDGKGRTFEVVLTGRRGMIYELTLELEAERGDIEALLIDRKSGRAYTAADFPRQMQLDNNEQRFQLVTGTAEYVQSRAQEVRPQQLELRQNYPNPFDHETRIEYTLPEESELTLEIFDALGRKVRTLFDGTADAGFHTAVWNGRNAAGIPAAGGWYICRLRAGDHTRTIQMLIVR